MADNDYLQSLLKLNTYGTFESDNGKITLMGSLRVFDEGVREIRVELVSRVPMYGEWRPVFEANGNDFNVEIVSFGYGDAFNVGNTDPKARQAFHHKEIANIKTLIIGLFSNSELRKNVSPFTSSKAKYLGNVNFPNKWIIQQKI